MQCLFSFLQPVILFQKQPPPWKCPFELMLTACLAQISLAYLLSAILLIYRIKKMDCKAIIHLLCNEITLHFSLLSLCLGEVQSCLAQVLVWWISSAQSCTSLLFPGSPKPERPPCSGGQKHPSTESCIWMPHGGWTCRAQDEPCGQV